MKFIFIAPRFHTNFYYPVKSLLDHGHQVEFWSLYRGPSESHDMIEPKVLGFSWLGRWSSKLKHQLPPVGRFIRDLFWSRADVLVIKDIVTAYSLLGLVFGYLAGKKLVVMTQIPKFRIQGESRAVAWLQFIFGAHAVTPVLGNPRLADSNPGLVYLPFVILTMTPDSKKYFDGDQINILCVGKFQRRKDQLLLIKAVEQLKDRFPLKLTLAGQRDEVEYLDQIRSYIHQHQLNDVVSIAEYAPWKTMSAVYLQSDLFVLPSYQESAAYSVLEAMAHGLPVLSSDDNGTQCYIRPGVNGYVFKHQDLSDLIDKIEAMVSDRRKLVQMGQASLDLAQQEHQPERFYRQIVELVG